MQEKIEHTIKVKSDCCCTGTGGWCKFFFESKNKSTTTTPALRPESAMQQPPHLDLETPRK